MNLKSTKQQYKERKLYNSARKMPLLTFLLYYDINILKTI